MTTYTEARDLARRVIAGLQHTRSRRGFSQEGLSGLCVTNVYQGRVSRIEQKGDARISPILDIADALNVSIDAVAEYHGTPEKVVSRACFGRNLSYIRVLRGVGQKDLAKRAGLSINCVFATEHGIHEPSLSTVCAIALALGVSLDAVCGRECVDGRWRSPFKEDWAHDYHRCGQHLIHGGAAHG